MEMPHAHAANDGARGCRDSRPFQCPCRSSPCVSSRPARRYAREVRIVGLSEAWAWLRGAAAPLVLRDYIYPLSALPSHVDGFDV